MKIGILTYHYAYNFGANLQVLSTVGYLRRIGHDPVVINWRPTGVEEQYRRSTPASQAQVHDEYAAAHLPESSVCRSAEEIAEVVSRERIDAVIVGSDAVVTLSPKFNRLTFSGRKLRFVYAKPQSVYILPNPFWGSFLAGAAQKIPCAMMSVSSQNTRYRLMSWQQRRAASESLRRFCYVSVRDTWTKGMMEWVSRGTCDPEITPDPVFSFNLNTPPELTGREVLKRFQLPDKYILVSFKRENCPPQPWVDEFARVAEARGYTCVALPYPQGLNALSLGRKVELPLGPLEWYAMIKYSAGYVGHNMHPIVSCIHNAVPFYSFDNYGFLSLKVFSNTRSSKIFDLLKATGMLANRSSAIGRMRSLPPPERVMEQLERFDRKGCERVAAGMQERYDVMMEALLEALGADAGRRALP